MDDGIGAAAGKIWHSLNKNGSMTVAKLTQGTGLTRDLTQRAIGWLAREHKLKFQTVRGSQKISLR